MPGIVLHFNMPLSHCFWHAFQEVSSDEDTHPPEKLCHTANNIMCVVHMQQVSGVVDGGVWQLV